MEKELKELKKQHEETEKLIVELRETSEKNDVLSVEKEEKLNARLDELDGKNQELVKKQLEDEKVIAEKEDKFQQRCDEFEKKLLRFNAGGGGDDVEKKAIEKAYDSMLRKGADKISPEELKYLRTDVDPEGGYLVSPDMDSGMIKIIEEFSPVRSLVRLTTTSKNLIKVRKRTGIPTAYRVGQGQEDTQSQSTYAMESINIERVTIDIPISIEELADPDFNMVSEMNQDAGEAFAVLEGNEFINGTGVGEMEGLLTNSDISETDSGVADAITGDGLIEMTGSLKDGYVGRFLLNRRTLATIRTLKNGTGQYIWQNGLAAGLPSTINGDQYVSAINMPDIAANAYPVVYGDYVRGYRMGENSQTSVLRDPFSQSRNGLVLFIFHRRNGGKVVLAEAIKKLKIST